MRPSIARLLPLIASATQSPPLDAVRVARRLEAAAPHVLARTNRTSVRERLLPSLVRAEVAHAQLLAKCGLSSDAPIERLRSRRKRIPAVAPPPPPAAPAPIDFFGKQLPLSRATDGGLSGLRVRAHDDVSDAAMWVAADRVGRMMRRQSKAVHQRLERADAAIHLVGRRQSVSDLPEHRHLKGRRGDYAEEAERDPRRVQRYGVWAERSEDGRSFRLPLLSAEQLTTDERTRGLGGLQASCGEENLLGLDVDPRYAGRDILTHEFAHCLMDYGLPSAAREAIVEGFERSVGQRGLWRRPDGSKAYAATNADEYFAELSMWFWGSHGEFADRARRLPPPGPRGLSAYDPDGFALVGAIYDGTHPALHGDKLGPPPVRTQPAQQDARSADAAGGESVEVTLEFVAAAKELTLAWIDADGERHDYGSVAPHGKRMQKTFAGHVWEATLTPSDDDDDDDDDAKGAGKDTMSVKAATSTASQRGFVRYRASAHEAQVMQAGDDLDGRSFAL